MDLPDVLTLHLIPKFFDIAVNLITAIVILVLGWWISSLCGRAVLRASQRSTRIDPTVLPMLRSLIVWFVRIFTILAVLSQFGVQTASLIAVLSAAGLAVGLALQGTLQNIAAGIMLLILRPIRLGEAVLIRGGPDGVVQEVGLFLTQIVQGDGIIVTLPNSVVWNATINNYSRNATRRLDLPVGIQYGDNLTQAVSVLTQLVNAHALILQDPKSEIRVVEYRDSVIIVNIRVWSKSSDFWEMQYDLYYKIRLALDEAGFKPPVPIRAMQNS